MTDDRKFPGLPYGDYPPPSQPPPHGGPLSWLAIIGAVLLAIGGYVFWATWATARECSSALVTALDPGTCTNVAFWHDAAGVGAIGGLVLVIVAVVRS
jgi:hypothetical protein